MSREKQNIFIFAYWHDKGWKRFVGATVKVWDLAHNMASLGHDVVLFLPKYDFPRENLPFQLVQIPLVDIALLRAVSFNFFLAGFLIRSSFTVRPDVVYIRRGISLLPGIFAKFRRAILFYEVNDDPYPTRVVPPPSLLTRLDRWLSRKTDELLLAWGDAVFVITTAIREKIIRTLPTLNHGKLHLLPSGANTDLYRPLDQRQCRLDLKLDLSGRYVGFMGTLLDHQGVESLIDAAPSIVDAFPETFFVIIGEGPMKEIWRKKAHERSLGRHFLFTGQVDYAETPQWINAMDVCTAPFLVKAGLRSPVKIFDYLACGKPVVASRIPGTTDIFDGSGAISLVAPGEPGALARAVVELLGNSEKAERMGRKGRALIETRYDRKVLARRIQDELAALQGTKTGLPDRQ